MSSNPKSTKLREEGNALYKAGKLVAAIKKYQEATKAAPDESAPLRNLSAAFYEVGEYKHAGLMGCKAIAVLREEKPHDEEAQLKKLDERIKKAAAHTNNVSEEERKQTREKIIRQVPRFHASMFGSTEYYTVGHDDVESLFHVAINIVNPQDKSVSFFMGGIGDARHMYRTIASIADHENTKKVPEKKYHFTINDINKCALVRDLIICMLHDELSQAKEGSDESLHILNTLFFVFIGTTMPLCAFEHLHQTIDKALESLQAEKSPLD